MSASIRTTKLPSGEAVPVLGQGTWYMGDSAARKAQEVKALQRGIDLGMTLIDTAEMYASGGAEIVTGEAIAGRRDQVFVVSKVLPSNASKAGTVKACEASLRRMKIDTIDLYLLHWRGGVPFADTISAFEQLAKAGKIRHWGVSNLDTSDMEELAETRGGKACATNQVLYNLARRGIEWDLLPVSRKAGLPIMAYSPIEQGRILRNKELAAVAVRHNATPAQVALAWVMRADGVIAIPKASDLKHVDENRASLDVKLAADDLAALDRAFPPPRRAASLEML